MKLNILNLGKPLSREEQKKIKGGDGLCDLGQSIECICSDGAQFPAVGDGVNFASQICDAGPCAGDGGSTARSNCQSA